MEAAKLFALDSAGSLFLRVRVGCGRKFEFKALPWDIRGCLSIPPGFGLWWFAVLLS